MPLILELRLLAIVPRVAFDPAFRYWPERVFGRLRVLFPDIGNRPSVWQVAFLYGEGDALPSYSVAAPLVLYHLGGLATLN
jgi:hypothetical protein